jgi:hypothetical protein
VTGSPGNANHAATQHVRCVLVVLFQADSTQLCNRVVQFFTQGDVFLQTMW